MGIIFDNSSAITVGSGTNVSTTHTCAGPHLILIAGVFSTTDSCTGLTYNGVALTQLTKTTGANGSTEIYLFYLIAPDLGAHTLAATFTTSEIHRVRAVSYREVLQSGFPDASTTNGPSAGTTLASSIVSVADKCWHVSFASASVTSSTLSAGASTTGHGTLTQGNGMFDNGADITPAGSNTTNTSTSSGIIKSIDVTIAPYIYPNGVGNFISFL